jgi:hypothetical protein
VACDSKQRVIVVCGMGWRNAVFTQHKKLHVPCGHAHFAGFSVVVKKIMHVHNADVVGDDA